MKIAWVIFAALERSAQGITSPIASIRYRALLPALELAKTGTDSHFVEVPPAGLTHDSPLPDIDANAVVFSKSFNPVNETLAQRARQRGARVVFDISDNHFDTPEYAAHYRAMAGLADIITVPTAAMAAAVLQHTGKPAIVIPDPVEALRVAPVPDQSGWGTPRNWLQRVFGKAAPPAPLRLLWFGHPANLNPLAALAAQLAGVTRHGPVQLRIVTQPGAAAEAVCATLTQHGITAEVTPWSLTAMRAALEWCQLVIIPSDADNPRTRVKSANRLLESLWAGRYVVASPIEAYQAFEEYAWVNHDLARGIVWAMQHPAAVTQQIERAQQHVAANLTVAAMATQWLDVVNGRSAGGGLHDKRNLALRLNLGCGDKPLPGYINVDVAPSRLGKKPDLLADLRARLPFPNECVDEVMAIHVIEHFWRWEVADVVREWARVLKPGGRLVLECPNLIAACQAFLEDPEQRAQPDGRGQTSMWVFYGDPQWQDPLMVHRWGYTPASLGALMQEAGLSDAHQEPAEFKLREPRDMRIVAVKPG